MLELLTLGAFALALVICLSFNVTVVVALLFGYVCFVVYGLLKKHTFSSLIIKSFSQVRTGFNVMLILLCIGMLTASWKIGGTIPYLVTCSVDIITPAYCLAITFALNAALSLLMGTAFGTAATMGIMTMTVCSAMGISPFLSGGAILAGAYVGDRNSPVSSSASLVSAVTGTNLYKNVRLMLLSSWIPFVFSLVIYLLIGFYSETKDVQISLKDEFSKEFLLSAWSLLPALVLLLLIFLKANIKLAILTSVLFSVLLAYFLEGREFSEILNCLIFGYKTNQAELAHMLDGGGIISMATVVVIIFISCTYAGLFEETGLLVVIKQSIKKLSNKLSPFTVVILTSVSVALIACNQVLTVMLTKQACEEIVPDKQKLAIDLENSAILVPALIPWSIAGAVPIATVGAPASCVLAAFFIYLTPLWSLATEKLKTKYWWL